MKQLVQNLRDGLVSVADVPAPRSAPGTVLVRTGLSLVSAGTERMMAEFGKAGWIDRARQQPDKVQMVLEKARTDGIAATLESVQSKLDQLMAPGYCNVGTVLEVGRGVEGFRPGDWVVCNGKHAEVVSVSKHLCARIPDGVHGDNAAFVVLAAIGLQGMRLANPTLGECVVVTGLGVIGLLTVQMLRAQGCRVLGIDPDPARRELAAAFGANVVAPGDDADIIASALEFSRGRGVDAVLITAATASNAPVRQAARMCRKRGRIVLVGVAGLELSRADFYEKELSFQVSCSYGPGRYDPEYESAGHDYPLAFVRWTEQRNFEAVLDLMAGGQLDARSLVSHRFPIERASQAYDVLTAAAPSLGILLEYPPSPSEHELATRRTVSLTSAPPQCSAASQRGTVALLGAGNYAHKVLAPAFKAAGATLRTVVSAGGVSAVSVGRKHGFAQASTDSEAAIADAAIDTVVIATRHNAHARQVEQSLAAGKHVFCEKPLCLTLDELRSIESTAAAHPSRLLMVGFNRRFAPHVIRMRTLLQQVEAPKAIVITVNAGAIPATHWTQDTELGGGRLIGEGCHFVDLLRTLADAPIVTFNITAMGKRVLGASPAEDHFTATLTFEDGSIGTLHYLANGHKGVPKERVEVLCAGRVLQLDNFRRLRGWGWGSGANLSLWSQDKGQQACVAAYMTALRTGAPAPIARAELFEVSRVTIEMAECLRNG
jgi:predicted dehydrogenase